MKFGSDPKMFWKTELNIYPSPASGGISGTLAWDEPTVAMR